MNLFVQGMRRSGTTITFDILFNDKDLDCYYEPLALAKRDAKGGGSGVTDIDYFEKVRQTREAFMRECPQLESHEILNHGAPTCPDLEFETDAPEYVWDYIRFMTRQAEHTAIKFTRMYNKVHILKEIDPEAAFVQIVRDPKAITASYLFGRGGKNKHLYADEKTFFSRQSAYSAWSMYPFSQYLLKTDEFRHLKDIPDFMRVLIIWKHTFMNTYLDGKKYFGDRFYLLRHEDLLNDPVTSLSKLYELMGRDVPDNVLEWAKNNINGSKTSFAYNNSRWNKAFRELDMSEALTLAGYDELVPGEKGFWQSVTRRLFG